MSISIPLSDDAEARLRRQAEAAGKDVISFVLEALEEKLAVGDDSHGAERDVELSTEQWIGRLRRLAAGHPALPYEVDDSREGIYSGRGE